MQTESRINRVRRCLMASLVADAQTLFMSDPSTTDRNIVLISVLDWVLEKVPSTDKDFEELAAGFDETVNKHAITEESLDMCEKIICGAAEDTRKLLEERLRS